MGINISFTSNCLKIQFSGKRMLMSLKKEFTIPYNKITYAKPHLTGVDPQGFRCPGTNWPRYIAAGTYYKKFFCPQKYEFWNVVKGDKAIEIGLNDNTPDKIVIDVDDRASILSKINYYRRLASLAAVSTIAYTHLVEDEVELEQKTTKLSGTLTLPDKNGYFPCIVFVSGSGPTDRDWNSPILNGKNGSGMLISQALAKQGFATIRFDKRGVGKSTLTDNSYVPTWDDYIRDLKSTIDYVRNLENINKNEIFIAAHSEGGLHTLKLCLGDYAQYLKGLILLASPGRSLATITLAQLDSQLSSVMPKEQAAKEIQNLKNAFQCVTLKQTLPDPESISTIPSINKLFQMFTSPKNMRLMEDLLDFNPADAISQTNLPTLIVSGAKDIQVDSVLDAKALSDSATQNGKTNVELLILPNSDHVFKYEPTPRAELTPLVGLNYNKDDRRLDNTVVPTMIDWINRMCAPHLDVEKEMKSNEQQSLLTSQKKFK